MLDKTRLLHAMELYEGLWRQVVQIDHPEAWMEWIDAGFEDMSPFHVCDIRQLQAEELQWVIATISRLHRHTPLNGDHRLMWAWCLRTCSSSSATLGTEWMQAFTHAALLIGVELGPIRIYTAVEPLLYALLEGGLRRLLPSWIAPDGLVRKDIKTSFGKHPSGKRLNRIGALVELFGKVGPEPMRSHFNVILKQMTERFGSHKAIEHQIDEWRCELLHGEAFSRARARYLMDLIALMVVSCVDPSAFEQERLRHERLHFVGMHLHEVPVEPPKPGTVLKPEHLEAAIAHARAELQSSS